ncbi:MAG: hypothetical protein WB615_04645, partial [Candidatus Tumulicola sp.]
KGNVQQVQTPGISGAAAPAWNATVGATTTDGGVAWINTGPRTWQAKAAYVAGQTVVDSNGYLQKATSAGTSGAAQPAVWNETPGGTTQDGTVAWTNAGFTWQPLFVDRSAVVRAGGLPRRRNVLPVESPGEVVVQPALAEARIAQLSEQVSEQLAFAPAFDNLASIATQLPPSGVLPATAMDLLNRKNVWLPNAWTIAAAPVHLEELEAALQTGMLAAPLDPSAPEDVEVLVPLPDALYDPNVLVTEAVAPDFQNELDSATQRRNATLRSRKSLQLELNVLETVLGPNAPQPNPNLVDPDAGLTADEEAGRDQLPAFWPQPSSNSNLDQTFGTHGPATWQSVTPYATGQLVIDSNGNFQKVTTAGTSGGTSPVWNATPGQNTTDANVTWLNAGSATWAPNTAYAAGQFVFDPLGYVQTVQTNGTSGSSQYIWNPVVGQKTVDGTVTWTNAGPRSWQPNFVYAAGQAVVDSNGYVQTVLNAGTSAASAPAWGDALEETTADGGVEWLNQGPPTIWARGIDYRPGQFFVDTNSKVQSVAIGGTSGATQFRWNATPGATTGDGTVVWVNTGSGIWQANAAYAAGQFVVDSNGNLQTVTTAGTSGATPPAWSMVAGATTQDGGVTWTGQIWTSLELQTLQVTASQAPYTISWPGWQASATHAVGQIITDSNGNLQVAQTSGTSGAAAPAWSTTAGAKTGDGTVAWSMLAAERAQIPLISPDDWSDLENFGLQHFIDGLNAKIKKANDLIDLAFLTTQTDIYRFRQNVLGATDASRLATSPILANIATGVTAAATAENLKDYFTSIQPAAATTPPIGRAASVGEAAAMSAEAFRSPTATGSAHAFETSRIAPSTMGAALVQNAANVHTVSASAYATKAAAENYPYAGAVQSQTYASGVLTETSDASNVLTKAPGASGVLTEASDASALSAFSAASAVHPGVIPPPSSEDVTAQSPIVGAQLDIRTLTIAERLAQAPSQESLFYAVGNRVGLMQLLLDLEITVDDLPFLVDASETPPAVTPGAPVPAIPVETHSVMELRDAAASPAVFSKMQSPFVMANSDEAGLFSSGVRVLEQHTQLLRAVEARVQTYTDFVTLCTTAVGTVQNDVQNAQTALKQLENELLAARQDLAFTASLLADEQQRVTNVNAQRNQILATSVQVVIYTRPRTLETEENVPSRQLVPGNVTSPVPTCLQQAISVPPELSEIVALAHEVPLAWFPSIQALLTNLRRPILLQQVAVSTQARATLQLHLPQPVSSALLAPSIYGPTIASIYQANQKSVRDFQTLRSTIVPAQLTNLSWSAQLGAVASVVAMADLTSSQAVDASVASALSRAQQQISSVAGCIYARANSALPVDRLAWAEFLRGPGLTVGLQSLSLLPNWTAQSYADRQQMQSLVDWLFGQIDVTNVAARAFMSDVVRVSILLASHAPVNDVIAGAITVRTQPSIGSTVTLNLPSPRIASGMYVQLYSKGNLAAEAVVNDLDSTSVSATVTTVHTPGVFLEASDVAHFTTQMPQAAALRAFSA